MQPVKVTGRNPFCIKQRDDGIVEIWLGTPGEPESEFVLTVSRLWLPHLIATLRMAEHL